MPMPTEYGSIRFPAALRLVKVIQKPAIALIIEKIILNGLII